jgi:hypothetical protein
MADPFTGGMAVLGMAGSAAGGVLGAMGARQEADATSAAATYNAGTARYQSGVALANARIARENKEYEIYAGEKEAGVYGMKAAQRKGSLVAQQGASGIDVNSGSSEDVQKSQDYVTSLDLRQIRENAGRRAYGYEVQAYGEEQQAKMSERQANLYDMQAKSAQKAGKLKVIGSLISGVTGVASKWSQAKQSGTF